MSNKNFYSGHGADTGGLQAHSIGPIFPHAIIGVGLDGGFAVLDGRNGAQSRPCRDYATAFYLASVVARGYPLPV